MLSCVGRTIALASQHGKERVLARPLRHGLGLTLQLATAVNTDLLGSFSGEYPRPEDALTTCRLKAEAGMDALGLDLCLASEWAFGPHPVVPFLPVGREWLTFVDRRHQLTISEYAMSRRTNYSSFKAASPEAALGWLKEVGFPSHAVMVGSPSAPKTVWPGSKPICGPTATPPAWRAFGGLPFSWSAGSTRAVRPALLRVGGWCARSADFPAAAVVRRRSCWLLRSLVAFAAPTPSNAPARICCWPPILAIVPTAIIEGLGLQVVNHSPRSM